MPEIVDQVYKYIDHFLNTLQLVAVVASVAVFFFLMINKYSKALKKILAPCGLGFWLRVKVMFICRKSQLKKRAFLEYAILQTGGGAVIADEWRSVINGFKAFYTEAGQNGLRYSISNCTPLIEPSFSQVTERYFSYFSQDEIRAAFGIEEEQVTWVIRLFLEEAYTTPTCLLTGLLSQYDESWEAFIKRYVSTAYISEQGDIAGKNVLSNELYFTFAWLLWGPSYELEFRNHWAGLCQISYGDESNSIPAIADAETGIAERLRAKFLENADHRYGALLSAVVAICDKKSLLASVRPNVNPDNLYFYDKVENNELSFGVKIEDFSPCLNYKAKKYYSTAYVWILFEAEDGAVTFQPEKSVAFFEHANLASNSTYQFLVETLIEKSLKHFEQIYADPNNATRKYRFICAMNDKIAIECIRTYQEVMQSGTPFGDRLKEGVSMEPKRTPSDVFAVYDEFFSPSELVRYVEVSRADQSSISDFGQFYTDVYMPAFPDEDEREGFDNFLKYLKQAEEAREYRYHIVLAKDASDRVIGGCIFNYYKKSNAGVIEFLAVRSDLQSGGIGSAIYKHIKATLAADAQAMVGKPIEYICCEIDAPEHSRAEIKKYLYFWNKNQFRHLNFQYVQPALSAGQNPVYGLWFTISNQHKVCDKVSGALVADVLYDYIKYAMGIEPETNEQYIAMRDELTAKGDVDLSTIV